MYVTLCWYVCIKIFESVKVTFGSEMGEFEFVLVNVCVHISVTDCVYIRISVSHEYV